MTHTFRFRLLVLGAALLALIAFVALLAHFTWAEAVAVRGHVRAVESESVRLAEHLRGAVQSLDTNLLRYRLGRDPGDWRDFDTESAELRDWLGQQLSSPRTARETGLLHAIETELAGYLDDARLFGAAAGSAPAGDALVAQLASLDQHSNRLLALGYDLAAAHNQTLDTVLARADRAIAGIERSTYLALGLLLAGGAGTGWLVYRDSIAPLQAQLRESRQRLERQEKLASLGVLSAGIAHEIRNPLTAVKARLFTLAKAVPRDTAAAEDVAVINSEVDRLERIVRDFLRFARPPEPVFTALDPVAELRRVRDLVAPQYAATGVRFELDESPAPAVRADAEQLQQALLNLVQNAAEAMPQGGTVGLAATAVAGRRPAVQLRVSDTGPGIAPEAQARLFDPFFTTKTAGTGLGLSLTARIVEKHGGAIRFETVAGRGTAFILVLPAAA